MADLNVMLLEHAKSGIQAKLDLAVTNGDTEAARKAADELTALNVAAAPKPAPTAYGEAEIRAELDKLDWFGTDPKKSARTVELGKTMNPKKFGSAADFAAALVKVVETEFKKADAGEGDGEGDGEGADGEDDGEGETGTTKPPAKRRASDGPSDGDTGTANRNRRTSGPWAKLSDAPADVQKEINRTADKFAPKTKEGREKYVAAALGAQYSAYKIRNGKK